MSAAHAPGRVRLLDPAAADQDAEHDWLPEALAAIDVGPVTQAANRRSAEVPPAAPHSIRELMEAVAARWSADASLALLTVDASHVGFIAWRGTPSPSQMGRGSGGGVTATNEILALAIRRQVRNLGYGTEAVDELERQEPAAGYLAAVPRTNGLAIYFWLRAGYRPLRPDEDEQRALDPATLWMCRSKASDQRDASGLTTDH